MKKFTLILMVLILSFFLPSSIFAQEDIQYSGAGDWDTILNQSIDSTSYWKRTSTVSSGGGDVRVCLGGVNAYNEVHVKLYSDNGSGDSNDEIVLPRDHFLNSGSNESHCFKKKDAEPYVDGTYAEFYVKVSSESPDTIDVIIQD